MPIIGVIASSAKGAPGVPTSVSATNVGSGRAFNNGRADVTFTPGAGATATSFTVTSSPGGFTGTGASSPISVTGLQSNTAYTFTVTATNAAGTSAASAASNSITATTVPQAPTIGTATGGNASASVTFTAGATGGSAITGFTATSSPGSITGTNTVSPITVSGLTNETAYTFTVTATNVNGTSLASAASNSVTPAIPKFFTITSSRTLWRGIAHTSAGIYAAGEKLDESPTTGIITRYNFDGTINWQRIYRINSSPGNQFNDIASDTAGNIYVVGRSTQSNNLRPFIARINPANGDIVWQRWITNSGFLLTMLSLKIDSSNRIWVIWPTDEYHLMEWDTNGNLVTVRRVSGMVTGNIYPTEQKLIDFRGNGNIVFGGAQVQQGKFDIFYTARFSESTTSFTNVKNWNYAISGVDGTFPQNLFVGGSNTMSLVGNEPLSARGTVANINIAVDPPTMGWARFIASTSLRAVTRDSANNVYALGREGIVTRFDSSGTLQWQRQVLLSSITVDFFACFLNNSTNLLYAVGANGSRDQLFVAALPIDGSGTGTYTSGGFTVSYAASSFTVTTSGRGIGGGVGYTYAGTTINTDNAAVTANTWTPSNTTITY